MIGPWTSRAILLKRIITSEVRFPHTRVAGMQGFVLNQRNEIFLSRKVRAAVAMVFDFQWSNKNLFYGQYIRNECYFDNNPEMKAKGLPDGEVKSILENLQGKYGSSFVPKTSINETRWCSWPRDSH